MDDNRTALLASTLPTVTHSKWLLSPVKMQFAVGLHIMEVSKIFCIVGNKF
jgi:hypothetical protein